MKYCSSCGEPAQNTMVMCAQCGTRNFSDMPNIAASSAASAQAASNPAQSLASSDYPASNMQATGLIQGVVPAGWLSSPPTPWRRYAARILDIITFGFLGFFVIGLVSYFIAPYSAEKFFEILSGPAGNILDIILTTLIGCVLSGAVIGISGSSLGKVLFGVMVVDQNGNKIGAAKGIQRDLAVYLRGLGLGIPLVSLITIIMAYSTLKNKGSTTWDTDNDYKVWHRPSGPGQYLLNVIGLLLYLIMFALLTVISM